jgi:hypothetical protein
VAVALIEVIVVAASSLETEIIPLKKVKFMEIGSRLTRLETLKLDLCLKICSRDIFS